MKKCIYLILFFKFLSPCFGQINISDLSKQEAIESDVRHFFNCMTSNEYFEKVARNNYYIFDTTGKYLYYGKWHPGFIKGKIIKIFKVDVCELKKRLPNYTKLDGFKLREIVLTDIANNNNINILDIAINNISYQLENEIIVHINFQIGGQKQQNIYKLDRIDFSIIKPRLKTET